jgi:hypothetical protein
VRGTVAGMMDELPSMESVLRALRELIAKQSERKPDAIPEPLPEEIERAIRE